MDLGGKTIQVSFGEGGIVEVRGDWGTEPEKFDTITEALGFCCRLREEERDQPCILLPPNALSTILKHSSIGLWNKGMERAEQMLASVAS